MVDIYPDKRKARRVGVKFIASYKVDKPVEMHMWVGDKEINALILDLSETGISILSDCDIPKATHLIIKFTLINLRASKDKRVRAIEIAGEVKHNILERKNEHRLGICFTTISKEDKQAITDFVRMAL